jgi:hypothetical protein
MARAPSIFRQSDITRAIRGALAAGVENVRVEIAKDGRLVVIITTIAPAQTKSENEWDQG